MKTPMTEHFKPPQTKEEIKEHGNDAVFYPPHSWIKVLAFGRPATLVGHCDHPVKGYPRSEYVVFDGDDHASGVHESKVSK